jgi:uncharacterized protein (DUF3084 family)
VVTAAGTPWGVKQRLDAHLMTIRLERAAAKEAYRERERKLRWLEKETRELIQLMAEAEASLQKAFK